MSRNLENLKDEVIKTGKYSETVEKAKRRAKLNNFEEITIYNYTTEVHLRTKDVEYEKNFNPRFIHSQEDMYKENVDELVAICKKANANASRQINIISNPNEDFIMNYQYIVFHKDLVTFIRNKINNIKIRNAHMKYGKLTEKEIEILEKIFPIFEKEWLVIDGNTYHSTIHQIWMAKKSKRYSDLHAIEYLSQYYAQRGSKGKGYECDLLEDKTEYEKELQFVQLVALVLEKNKHSWNQEDILAFEKILIKLLNIVCYKQYMLSKEENTAYDYLYKLSCVKYLILPNIGNSYKTRILDYITLCALFEDEDNNIILTSTAYTSLKMLRQVIEGVIIKRDNYLYIDYAFDCINEVFKAMVKYQDESLKALDNFPLAKQKRDRLYNVKECWEKFTQLDAKNETLLQDEIVNKHLSMFLIGEKLNRIVESLISLYKSKLSEEFAERLEKNEKVQSFAKQLYKERINLTYEEFFNQILEMMKSMD